MSAATPPPVHMLMEDGPPRPRLARALERDFVGRRYHMEQHPPSGAVAAPDLVWNGATEDERAILSTIDVLDDDDDDDDGSPTMRWNDPVAFVGRMIEHPVLAIAILERIAQQDAHDRAEFEATSRMLGFMPPAKRQKKKTVDDDDSDYSIMDEGGDDGHEESSCCEKNGPGSREELPERRSESPKRCSSSAPMTNDSESSGQLTVLSAQSDEHETQEHANHELVITGAVVQAQPKTPPVRLEAFIQAGGLMILSRFLLEASPSFNDKVLNVERKMEPLLVPLLNLLSKIPFDLKAIKESRINKGMKALKRDLDLAESSPLRVRQKLALGKLMDKWETMAKEAGKKKDHLPVKTAVVDPFAELNAQLDDRLNLLESGTNEGAPPDEVPSWLAKLQAEATTQVPAKPTPSRVSTGDLARKERENERAAHMRKDLEETQRKRREVLQKLRAMKSTEAEAPARRPATHSVKWADGHGRTSRMRIRNELERVVEFNKDDMARLVGDEAKHDPTLL